MYIGGNKDVLHVFLFLECTAETATVKDVFLFCTAFEEVPPMGLDYDGITIEYLPEGAIMPNAGACFGIIRLPISNETKESFYAKMDQGILYSNGHYGVC